MSRGRDFFGDETGVERAVVVEHDSDSGVDRKEVGFISIIPGTYDQHIYKNLLRMSTEMAHESEVNALCSLCQVALSDENRHKGSYIYIYRPLKNVCREYHSKNKEAI